MTRIHDRITLNFQGLAVSIVLGLCGFARAEEPKTTTKLETITPSEDTHEGDATVRFGDPESMVEEDVTEPSVPVPPVAAPSPSPAVSPPATVPISEQVRMVLDSITAGTEFAKEVELLVRLGEEAVPALANAFTDSTLLWERRWAAAMALGQIGGNEARVALESKMKDPLFVVRMASARSLGQISDARSIPILHEALNDPAMFVRATVIDALARMKKKESIEPLIAELKSPKNFYRGQGLWVRAHIVDALASIGDEQVVPPLVNLLSDEDPELRLHACEALAQVRPDAQPPAKLSEGMDCVAHWRAWAKTKTVRLDSKGTSEIKIPAQ